MATSKISIKDIAARLNISITTVSFIINGKAEEKRISKDLSEKVLQYINEVGYVPHHTARSLRTGKTNVIGLIVEDISNQFFANVARHIEAYAEEKGYRIFYCSAENDTKKANELIKLFRERNVDGYIITPAPGIEESVKNLLAEGLPLVLFDRYLPGVKSNSVIVDNEGGAYNATKHLIAQGYKNIGFVTLESGQTQMKARLKGYTKAIEEGALTPSVLKIVFNNDNTERVNNITSYLKLNKKLDAVFFATNYLGISGLEAIKLSKLSIPKNIAVLSFDDHDLFRLYNPAITAIAQPIQEMTKQAMNILLHEMSNNDGTHKKIVIKPELVIRDSSIKK